MFRTPEAYGYFTTSVNPVTDLALILSGTYTGRMLVEHHQGYIAENRTELTPRFFELNFKVTYDFRIYNSITLQINAGVGNILNSYQRDFDQGPRPGLRLHLRPRYAPHLLRRHQTLLLTALHSRHNIRWII